jgi:hypothetical protein
MAIKKFDKCYAKAADDEPIWVTRAQDLTGPAHVVDWIARNIETAPKKKLIEALELAIQMREWPKRKVAD